MTNLICITCPKGCHLHVDEQNGYEVTGNNCPRGEAYGRNELLNPVRVVTSTVVIRNAALPRLPVKTEAPIPKKRIFACMKQLDGVVVTSPVHVGDVIISNVMGTGINVVACKTM